MCCGKNKVGQKKRKQGCQGPYFTPTGMAIIKKQMITNVAQHVGKLAPSSTAQGNVTRVQLPWKTVLAVRQNVKHRITI